MIPRSRYIFDDSEEVAMSDSADRSEFEAAVPRVSESMARAIQAAQQLLGAGIEGVGQGTTPDGREAVTLMVARLTPELEECIPDEIEGYPVEIVETGIFQAGG
jgi:hypothetical protein